MAAPATGTRSRVDGERWDGQLLPGRCSHSANLQLLGTCTARGVDRAPPGCAGRGGRGQRQCRQQWGCPTGNRVPATCRAGKRVNNSTARRGRGDSGTDARRKEAREAPLHRGEATSGEETSARRGVTASILQRPCGGSEKMSGSILSERRQWADSDNLSGDLVWALLQYGGNPYLRPSSAVSIDRI